MGIKRDLGVKRGNFKQENVNKLATIRHGSYGAAPAPIPKNGMSNSENYLQQKSSSVPQPGVNALKGVSDYRREELIRSADVVKGSIKKYSVPVIANSASYKRSQEIKEQFMKKVAAITNVNMGSSGGSVVRQAPAFYSPLFQMANLQLPRERITMNAWNRNFYDTNPLVHNCINLHATYPIGKLNIKCKDRKIELFFNEMVEEMDLMEALQNIALEFFTIGEAFPYLELDENRGIWKNVVVQNPDYIHIKKSVLSGEPVITMRPDAALQRLVQSSNPSDMQLRNQIDEEILYHIRKGNNIPLDNFHVSHLKMLARPYDTHGTSMIVSIYKDLMLYDREREAKFAQADNLINPITLVKVGGTGEGEYHPSSEDLEHWRQIMEESTYDHDFKIISHAGVAIERIGAAGQIIDISADMTLIIENILTGLMVPKAIITQEGAAFNSASIGLEVLKQRYETFRNMMAKWLTKKVFAPISEIQEFYEYKDGDKKLIVPDVEWNKMILFDMDNYINILNGLVDKASVSQTTLFRSLGLNKEEEHRLVKEEMIEKAILVKEQQILQGMTLGALRSIKPDEDIIEPTEAPLPGTTSEDAGIPGVAPPPTDLSSMLGGGGSPGGGLGMPGGLTPPMPEMPAGPGAGGLEAPKPTETAPAPPTPAPTK